MYTHTLLTICIVHYTVYAAAVVAKSSISLQLSGKGIIRVLNLFTLVATDLLILNNNTPA